MSNESQLAEFIANTNTMLMDIAARISALEGQGLTSDTVAQIVGYINAVDASIKTELRDARVSIRGDEP